MKLKEREKDGEGDEKKANYNETKRQERKEEEQKRKKENVRKKRNEKKRKEEKRKEKKRGRKEKNKKKTVPLPCYFFKSQRRCMYVYTCVRVRLRVSMRVCER